MNAPYRSILFLVIFFLIVFSSVLNSSGRLVILDNLTHETQAFPGSDYQDQIVIANYGNDKIIVEAYQTDYLFQSDGETQYVRPAGQSERSNAPWITFYPSLLFLEPDQKDTIFIHVHVPNIDSLRGTYWSMMMVSEKTNQDNEKVKSLLRYGIQMITQIGQEGKCVIRVLQVKILKEGNKRLLNIDIQNIGKILVKPIVWIDMVDDYGKKLDRLQEAANRIFPDTSIRQTFDITHVPPAQYQMLIVIDCGDENLFGVRYHLKL